MTAYVEPVAVADRLPSLPIFLEPGLYVPAPLEATYLFDGGSGTNTAKLWGSTSTTAKDVAELFATKASFRGPGYTLSLAGMRGMTVAGQGGAT